MGSWTVSRLLSRVTIHLGPTLLPTSCTLPVAMVQEDRRLFELAPSGVCPAKTVTSLAVGSYPTISPLPHLFR